MVKMLEHFQTTGKYAAHVATGAAIPNDSAVAVTALFVCNRKAVLKVITNLTEACC